MFVLTGRARRVCLDCRGACLAPRGFDKIIAFGTRPDGGRNGASAYARRRHSVTQVCDVGKETV
mgnify:CR=1 FL=1